MEQTSSIRLTSSRAVTAAPAVRTAIVALLAALVFIAYASQVVLLFYGTGATTYDAGWFAYVLSRFDIPPDNPLYLQQRGIPSFFAFHVAPLMPLWGGLSQLLGLAPPLAYALYQGFFHALLLVIGYRLLPQDAGTASGEDFGTRVLAGLALAFSPIALSAITYLHHEMAMPILFIGACLAWARGRTALAAVVFALSLSVRTDAGFHAATFLFAFAAAHWLIHRRIHRAAVIAGAVAFAWSVVAFAIVHVAFPQFSNLRFSYVGNRFDHVGVELIFRRIGTLLDKRPELFVLGLAALGIGWLRRCWYTAAGALAVLPWVGLHLIAARDIPGELYTYYAFPFLILAAWPVLTPHLVSPRGTEPEREPLRLKVWFASCAVALLVYLASPFTDAEARDARWASLGKFVPQVGFERIRTLETFASNLEPLVARQSPATFVDEGTASLMPDTGRDYIFQPGERSVPSEGTPFLVSWYTTHPHAPEIERLYGPAVTECFALEGTVVRLMARDVPEALVTGLHPRIARGECPVPATPPP